MTILNALKMGKVFWKEFEVSEPSLVNDLGDTAGEEHLSNAMIKIIRLNAPLDWVPLEGKDSVLFISHFPTAGAVPAI